MGRKAWTYSSSSSLSSLGRATSSSSCFLFLVDITEVSIEAGGVDRDGIEVVLDGRR